MRRQRRRGSSGRRTREDPAQSPPIFADTSIDRMALQVAAELIEESESTFEELTPEKKEAMPGDDGRVRLRRSRMNKK